MKEEDLLAIAKEAAKNIKTEHDLSKLTKMLSKITIDGALNAELDDHLVTIRMKLVILTTVVMDQPTKQSRQKMASLKLMLPEIERGILSQNWLKRINVACLPLKIKLCILYARLINTRNSQHI